MLIYALKSMRCLASNAQWYSVLVNLLKSVRPCSNLRHAVLNLFSLKIEKTFPMATFGYYT